MKLSYPFILRVYFISHYKDPVFNQLSIMECHWWVLLNLSQVLRTIVFGNPCSSKSKGFCLEDGGILSMCFKKMLYQMFCVVDLFARAYLF